MNELDNLRYKINALVDAIAFKKLQYRLCETPNQYQLFELANLRRELRYLMRIWNSLV